MVINPINSFRSYILDNIKVGPVCKVEKKHSCSILFPQLPKSKKLWQSYTHKALDPRWQQKDH